ncbi:Gti1/Pac2 family-domain-containing protein [Mycena rebaudengoi]|nr:Gti1/Pac2 family-domain-containing protein [Mycena rebaudengoi]
MPTAQHWHLPTQQPTCTNLRIRSTDDAHKIFYAVRKGLLRMVTRRLDADERGALRTGCVYAWEERSPNTEITGLGIERFTEGRRWSPSRVRDEFLFYYEKYVPPDPNSTDRGVLPYSPMNNSTSEPADWDQLVKQTYSVWVDTDKGRRKWHLTAYFTQTTVDRLGTVDELRHVGSLDVPPGTFTSTRVSKLKGRNSDANGTTQSSVTRTYAAFPSPMAHAAPSAKTSALGQNTPSVQMYEPYPKAQSHPHPYYSPTESYTPTLPPLSVLPPLHFQYSPQPNGSGYPRVDMSDHPRAGSARLDQPQARFSNSSSPQNSMDNCLPRHSSPHSDSTSSSSSSYAPSPSAYTTTPLEWSGAYTPPTAGTPLSLPRLQMPPESFPAGALLLSTSPMDAESERRGDIGPCRDLAPLNSLTRLHPYKRDPNDDKALRKLARPAS